MDQQQSANMLKDPEIIARYEEALRFDEGEVFLSPLYSRTKEEQMRYYDLLVATFGEGVIALLDEYTATLFTEMECEAQHFFQEGYRVGKMALG